MESNEGLAPPPLKKSRREAESSDTEFDSNLMEASEDRNALETLWVHAFFNHLKVVQLDIELQISPSLITSLA